MYTPRNVSYRDDDKLTGAPLRLFHGIADDWERIKKAGADVILSEYPGAYHAYDGCFRPQVIVVPAATTTRSCQLEEGENGVILNSKTGKPYDITKDSCVEKGPHVGYNEAATVATTKAVKEFLTITFKLPKR
jgi:dienelactone hydrolase